MPLKSNISQMFGKLFYQVEENAAAAAAADDDDDDAPTTLESGQAPVPIVPIKNTP